MRPKFGPPVPCANGYEVHAEKKDLGTCRRGHFQDERPPVLEPLVLNSWDVRGILGSIGRNPGQHWSSIKFSSDISNQNADSSSSPREVLCVIFFQISFDRRSIGSRLRILIGSLNVPIIRAWPVVPIRLGGFPTLRQFEFDFVEIYLVKRLG